MSDSATPSLRQGLPRTPGGAAWPPAPSAPASSAAEQTGVGAHAVPALAMPDAGAPPLQASETAGPSNLRGSGQSGSTDAHVRRPLAVRRGLPRVVGGEAWPPATAGAAPRDAADGTDAADDTDVANGTDVGNGTNAADAAALVALRQGLPREAGGEPWPPAVPVAPHTYPPHMTGVPAEHQTGSVVGQRPPASESPKIGGESTPEAVPTFDEASGSHASVDSGPRPPLTVPRTVFAGRSAFTHPTTRAESIRYGRFTRGEWAGIALGGGAALLYVAAMAVFAVRWLLSLEPMQDFLVTYPGEYHLPEGAPVGFPAWLGWQHFFNVFLMVLIIRSGLQVRHEKRPPAFWSPRNNPKRRISISLWFHQSLDILWLVNGVVFIVLLFVTGQWLRIVPTSWEVFPNAISSVLQYISLNWPTENGWVNYNSLQQLAYFTTVFVAAPLAAVTGVRMSGIWPATATRLNKAFPVEWARAVHFPVMLYFVFFIIVHVALVFATGALRNLNHMYAAQDVVNWTGFWIFAASMFVIAMSWIAARPLVLAPIAKLFGTVKGR